MALVAAFEHIILCLRHINVYLYKSELSVVFPQLLHQPLHQDDKLGRSTSPLPTDRQAHLDPFHGKRHRRRHRLCCVRRQGKQAAAAAGSGRRRHHRGGELDGCHETLDGHGGGATALDRDLLGYREEEQRRVGLESAQRGENGFGATSGMSGD